MKDPVPLLQDLVRSPSVSGSEGPALEHLARWFADRGIPHRIEGRNFVAELGRGPALLLNAHIDTVPAGPGWTRDPLGGEIEGDRLFGLGSNDNKASLAAMACAFAALVASPPPAGRVIFAATCDEETGGEGLEWLRPRLPEIHSAVISEPTDFRVAIAQRGLVRLTATARGRTAHASRPWEGVNAVDLALEDIARLKAIPLHTHALLGSATLEVTRIDGGTAANMLPGECTFTADGRPVPGCDNDYFERHIRTALQRSEIAVLKCRMTPVVTPADSAVARAALEATGNGDPSALGGVSDLFHVRDLPAVVVGPGTPDQSHQPDESVSVTATRKAVEVYARVAWSTLSEISS